MWAACTSGCAGTTARKTRLASLCECSPFLRRSHHAEDYRESMHPVQQATLQTFITNMYVVMKSRFYQLLIRHSGRNSEFGTHEKTDLVESISFHDLFGLSWYRKDSNIEHVHSRCDRGNIYPTTSRESAEFFLGGMTVSHVRSSRPSGISV